MIGTTVIHKNKLKIYIRLVQYTVHTPLKNLLNMIHRDNNTDI